MRKVYETFQVTRQPEAFVDAIRELRNSTGVVSRENAASHQQASEQQGPVRRKDLRLICFEYVWA